MKIIFLDIDGVLNWAGTEDRIGGFVGLCQERIARLNKITDAVPDAKIVISSTWRRSFFAGVYEDFEGLIKLLHARGVKGDIIGKTPYGYGYRGRGNEIREWIDDMETDFPGQTLEEYVVLDDSTDCMEGHAVEIPIGKSEAGEEQYEVKVYGDLRPRHVVSYWVGEEGVFEGNDVEGGLQDKHVEQAIEVLNGKLIKVKPLEVWTVSP